MTVDEHAGSHKVTRFQDFASKATGRQAIRDFLTCIMQISGVGSYHRNEPGLPA
jgi:hypothetical protein